jgi:hypothetical protein
MSFEDDLAAIERAFAHFGAPMPDLTQMTAAQLAIFQHVAAKHAPGLRALESHSRADAERLAGHAANMAAAYAARAPVTEVRVHRLGVSQQPLTFTEVILFPPMDAGAGVTWQVTFLIRVGESAIQVEVFKGEIGSDTIAHTTANIASDAATTLLAQWQREAQRQ